METEKRRKCGANKTTIEATERGVEYESSRDTDVDGIGRRPRGKDPALVFGIKGAGILASVVLPD